MGIILFAAVRDAALCGEELVDGFLRDVETMQVVFGRAGDADEIVDPVAAPLQLDGAATDGVARFSGAADLGQPGPFGYTIRVLPRHRLLAGPAELGLVTVPDAPTGLVNGDLR